jgi:heme/copper-type cytochrome/quinol oxidase subunit 2
MIAIALFVLSALLFGLTSYRREHTVSPDGTRRPDRTTAILMLQAVCAAIAAIVVATVDMVTTVS